MIHSDEYRDWLNHPVTEEFFKSVSEGKQYILNELLSGQHLESHPRIARYLGMVEICDTVINYKPEFNDSGYMIDTNGDVVE
jgi:hypothetical protein